MSQICPKTPALRPQKSFPAVAVGKRLARSRPSAGPSIGDESRRPRRRGPRRPRRDADSASVCRCLSQLADKQRCRDAGRDESSVRWRHARCAGGERPGRGDCRYRSRYAPAVAGVFVMIVSLCRRDCLSEAPSRRSGAVRAERSELQASRGGAEPRATERLDGANDVIG